MKKNMRHIIRSAFISFALGAACVALVSCDPVSKAVSETILCSDENYPLLCIDSQICCAETHPFECNEKCYRTKSQAQSSCSGEVNNCQ